MEDYWSFGREQKPVCRFLLLIFNSIRLSFDLQKHFSPFFFPLLFYSRQKQKKKQYLANHQINFLVIFLFSSLFHFHRNDLVKNKSNTKWIGHTHTHRHIFKSHHTKINRSKFIDSELKNQKSSGINTSKKHWAEFISLFWEKKKSFQID